MYDSKPVQDLFLFTNIHCYEKNINCFFKTTSTIFLFWLFSFTACVLWRKLLAILQLNDDYGDDDDELIIYFTGIYVLGTCTHLITSYQE